MNPRLDALQPYPFQRLRSLFGDATTPLEKSAISLGIGEPQHASPEFVQNALAGDLDALARYPTTQGTGELRESIADWLCRRFALSSVNPDTQVLPVNGTREALFAFAQAVVDSTNAQPLVLSPNPFYQIYEGAALLAGAEPYFLNCTAENEFLPDFESIPDAVWARCQLLYLCTPGNPTGALLDGDTLASLIERAHRHDFVIASDECYSEIYFDEGSPPPGLLQASKHMGNDSYRRCVVFHSLSKRSNLPGLRSGFVAGDADILQQFTRYRTYHGCAMPLHHQTASIAAWSDEHHVQQNRNLYRAKFDAVLDILDGVLDVTRPDAGFYLWPRTPIDDTTFAKALYQAQGVTVLPGQYLAREAQGINPGQNRIRMALVAELDECVEAAQRIAAFTRAL